MLETWGAYNRHHVEVKVDGPDCCRETSENLVVLCCVLVTAGRIHAVNFAEDKTDITICLVVEEIYGLL